MTRLRDIAIPASAPTQLSAPLGARFYYYGYSFNHAEASWLLSGFFDFHSVPFYLHSKCFYVEFDGCR